MAYQGVVPVKVSRQEAIPSCEFPGPRAGQLLVPSGQHDGTAVVVPAGEGVSRVGILLDSSEADAARDQHDVNLPWCLMQTAVVTPAETVVGSLPTRLLSLQRMVIVALAIAVAILLVSTRSKNTQKASIERQTIDNERDQPGDLNNGGVTYRSCDKVDCPSYKERNAQLQYDAIINFAGV